MEAEEMKQSLAADAEQRDEEDESSEDEELYRQQLMDFDISKLQ